MQSRKEKSHVLNFLVLSILCLFQCLSFSCFSFSVSVRDGFCADSPLCRGTSQGKYGSKTIDLVCAAETVGMIGEIDEIREIELVLVVSVKCDKE